MLVLPSSILLWDLQHYDIAVVPFTLYFIISTGVTCVPWETVNLKLYILRLALFTQTLTGLHWRVLCYILSPE